MSAQSSQNQATDQTQATNGTTAYNSSTNPWAVQAPYLSNAFSGAQSALGTASQFTPEQLDAFQQQVKYGLNNPGIAASSANAGGTLTGAGANAAQTGLYGLAHYDPSTASSVMANANTFRNPNTQAMIDAATRDMTRAVNEQGLPQIDRTAALTGNTDSSRTGAQDAILKRGLAENVGDVSANIRGQQYQSGISNALNLAGLQQSGNLGALSGLVSGGTGAAGTGVGANTGAVQQQGGLYGLANTGLQGLSNAPFSALQNYYGIIGANNWGGTTSGTAVNNGMTRTLGNGNVTNNPSQLAQAGAWGGILSSLF